MPKIVETVITTISAEGRVHLAPLGLIEAGAHWVVAPFVPSTTLANIRAVPEAVASHVTDVRVIAGCLTGRRDWPLMPVPGSPVPRLAAALSHWHLRVAHVAEDAARPRFQCETVGQGMHAPFTGFNRAQAAVLEAAILVSRLHMLPPEKVAREIAYLRIAIDKTAGPEEREAWGWLMQRVEGGGP